MGSTWTLQPTVGLGLPTPADCSINVHLVKLYWMQQEGRRPTGSRTKGRGGSKHLLGTYCVAGAVLGFLQPETGTIFTGKQPMLGKVECQLCAPHVTRLSPITLGRQIFYSHTDEENGDSEWCSKSIPRWVSCRAELHTPAGSSEPSVPHPRGAEGF